MKTKRYFIRITTILFCGAQLLLFNASFAAGFQLNETSPGLQGAATAGAAAAANDVSAMFTNPAILASLRQNQIYFGSSFIYPEIKMTDANAVHTVNIPGSPPSDITAIVQGTNSQSNITSWAFVPDGYVGYRLNDHLVAGIAVTSPFGLTTDYNRLSVLRFAAQESSLLTININPALAIQLNSQWAVGAGLQLQYAQAVFSNFNGPYTGIPAIDAFIAANYPSHFRADGWGYGANVGVFYIPCQGTRLGVGYRSQIIQDLSGLGQQYTSPGPTVPAPSQDFLFNARTHVTGSLNIPAVLTMSVAQDIENWTIKASAQLNFWNSFKHLSVNAPDAFGQNSTIQAHWQNTWLLAFGADYRLSCDWTLRAGVAFDQTPTQNQYRDPRIPDSNRTWATGGFTYRINQCFSMDGAYEHIFAQNQRVNVTQASGSSATSTLPLEVNQVSARYQSSVNIVAFAIRYQFC